MSRITLKNGPSYEANATQRLVLALEDNGVDVLHRCGGFARCTTCRVIFHEGEPTTMTVAERDRLQAKELLGQVRLSCQILCDHDMTVEPVYRLSTSEYDNPGARPEESVTPEPEWIERPY